MIELLRKILDLLLHLDTQLDFVVERCGPWIYLVLFLIIFCETGLVVTPILPGDSLLFAIGAFAARPNGLNLYLCMGLLALAVISGDNVNYWAGYFLGPKVFSGKARL